MPSDHGQRVGRRPLLHQGHKRVEGGTVDPDVTLTCQLNQPVNLNVACGFAPFVDAVVSSVGRTGFVQTSAWPRTIIDGTNVKHPGGTLGTLYVNGVAQPVPVPAFCSGTDEFCDSEDYFVAVIR